MPAKGSVYKLCARTTTRKLNDDRHKMPFYLLVQKLRDEATDVVITAVLTSDRKVKHLQRRKYCTVESHLFTALDCYANELSAMHLLSECAHFTAF